jgi:hypothetical protein
MKQLNEKAMLVKLTMRRANLTRRDQTAEAIIQNAMDDQSLIVSSKLFRDKTNPINKIMAEASAVYQYHKLNTLPYIDKGPRILPNNNYMEYTAEMRSRIARVDSLLDNYLPNWDTYVQLDLAYRSTNKTNSRAQPDDYPSAEEFREKMGFDLRFSPLPEAKHFLYDIDEADLEVFNSSIKEAERVARVDCIKRMLEPLEHLVDKLQTPIGAEGSIFRDSAIDNVLEGLDMARRLNMDESPELTEAIGHLSSALITAARFKDSLRESPVVREQAAAKLKSVANKMAGLM